jgi:hypothetical protein
MPRDRQFTNPNFGNQARVEVHGREVRLIFVASTEDKANDLAENMVRELANGSITVPMMGKPTSIVEE